MHIGFRYHVASLVAIFFSLFIGILVGSILFQDDLLIQEQDSIIGDIEGKFQQLELRTAELQTNLILAQNKEKVILEAWDQMRGFFVNGQLDSTEVVLANIFNSDTKSRLNNLLEQSGARIIDASFEASSEFVEQFDPEKLQVIVYWHDGTMSESDVTFVNAIMDSGWQVCILQPYDGENIDADIANRALIVEFADTLVGELALIQGLAQNFTQGRSQ